MTSVREWLCPASYSSGWEENKEESKMTKVLGNKNTARYFTRQYVDKNQMKKAQHRAYKKAWEMMIN